VFELQFDVRGRVTDNTKSPTEQRYNIEFGEIKVKNQAVKARTYAQLQLRCSVLQRAAMLLGAMPDGEPGSVSFSISARVYCLHKLDLNVSANAKKLYALRDSELVTISYGARANR
jgi:hypothetical protein